MKLGIKLNLQKVLDDIATFTDGFDITFDNISNLTGWSDEHAPFIASEVTNLNIYGDIQDIYLIVSTEETSEELVGDNITDVSSNGNSISFTCEIMDNELSQVLYFVDKGYIELDQFGNTNMIVYRLNDERHKLNKSLTPVTILEGKFTAPLGIKALELDVVNYDINNSYNYIYIPKLKRYYYVTNIQLTTKDYTKLILQEDVLMSWSSLIKEQSAFVTRYGASTNTNLVDNRLPLEDSETVKIENLTPTASQQTKVNVTLNFDVATSIRNFLIVTKDTWNYIYPNSAKIDSIVSGKLPDIAPHDLPNQNMYLMSATYIGDLIQALMNDDATASYLTSIIWLPFDPSTLLNANADDINGGVASLFMGNKELRVNYGGREFVDYTTVLPTTELPKVTYQDINFKTITQIPYIVVFDGKYVAYDDWKAREPYTNYELHVPFVGYVKLSGKDFLNQRIIIYYSLDHKSGTSTCYIYNFDKGAIIYSANCQLGIKLELTTSNTLENTKQKQSAELNMILGLVSSAVSVGIGVATENPVAVVGGVLSASKTIASNVNINRQIFERAQTSYGTNDGALFDSLSVYVRVTYHRDIFINSGTYAIMQGYPYNEYIASLSSLTTGNYVEIGEIHFNAKSNNIYQVEIEEIIALLKNGVII